MNSILLKYNKEKELNNITYNIMIIFDNIMIIFDNNIIMFYTVKTVKAGNPECRNLSKAGTKYFDPQFYIKNNFHMTETVRRGRNYIYWFRCIVFSQKEITKDGNFMMKQTMMCQGLTH